MVYETVKPNLELYKKKDVFIEAYSYGITCLLRYEILTLLYYLKNLKKRKCMSIYLL